MPKIVLQSTIKTQDTWGHCVKTAPAIKDLCQTLGNSRPTNSCLGILDDVAFGHHVHSAMVPRLQSPIARRITLQEILERNAGQGFDDNEKFVVSYSNRYVD